jgi:hypothetical protein
MDRAWSFAGWYCRHGETLSGPFRPEQIKTLVASGRLRLTDRIWERWSCGWDSLFFPALVSTVFASGQKAALKRQAKAPKRGAIPPPPVAVR